MDTYNSFEEKDQYFKFGGLKIDTDKDFKHYSLWLQVQFSKEDFIFRGVPEAKYKIFSSAQRKWHEIASKTDDYFDEEKYDNFIISLMKKCKEWNLGTVPNLLNTYNINENNAIAYLSFMQHYEMPTPLIDFTKKPNKALFFAVNSIPDKISESSIEINNYFSIYYAYQTNPAYEIFKHIFDENRENNVNGEFNYEDLTKNGITLITDRIDEFKIVNNIRIANQEGLFFYNNSPYLSIEEQYKEFSDLLLLEIGKEELEKLLIPDTFAGCLNFHKKYAKHIKEILNQMQITSEFIYPEINDLKKYLQNFVDEKTEKNFSIIRHLAKWWVQLARFHNAAKH